MILATPKFENDVRLRVTLGSQNPTGKPVGAVRSHEPVSKITCPTAKLNLTNMFKHNHSFSYTLITFALLSYSALCVDSANAYTLNKPRYRSVPQQQFAHQQDQVNTLNLDSWNTTPTEADMSVSQPQPWESKLIRPNLPDAVPWETKIEPLPNEANASTDVMAGNADPWAGNNDIVANPAANLNANTNFDPNTNLEQAPFTDANTNQIAQDVAALQEAQLRQQQAEAAFLAEKERSPDPEQELLELNKLTNAGEIPLLIYGGKNNRFLGCLNCHFKFKLSIWNNKGPYGSNQSLVSIWNDQYEFGSELSSVCPWNPLGGTPPAVVDTNGNFYGFLSLNPNQQMRFMNNFANTLLQNHENIAVNSTLYYQQIFAKYLERPTIPLEVLKDIPTPTPTLASQNPAQDNEFNLNLNLPNF